MPNSISKNIIRPVTKGIDTLVEKTNVLNVYDNVVSSSIENLLSTEQMNLFNGFDELGGTITKYDDAANWYKNVNYKYEALVLAIIILDKPSAWLFSGISNGVVKKIQIEVDKVSKLRNLAKQQEDLKSDVCTNFKYEVENSEYLELVNDLDFKIIAETRTCLNPKLIRSMATFTDSELESMDNEQLNRMSTARSQWNDCFKLVNISRMKRVAMMYIEMVPSKYLIKNAKRWIDNHNGRFLRQTNLGPNEESIKIMKESIKEFRLDKDLWKRHRKLFSIKLRQDLISDNANEYEYNVTKNGRKFINMCNKHSKIQHLDNKFQSDNISIDSEDDV